MSEMGAKGRRQKAESVPQGWQRVKLGDIATRTKGKIVPTNREGLGIPYIGAKSLGGDFEEFTQSEDALICSADDVLILWDGEYAGNSATGLAGAVSSTVARLRLSHIAHAGFLQARLEADNVRIRRARTGSGIPHMPSDFEQWYIFSLPPLPEQRKIAAILGTWDDGLATLAALITAKREQKRGLAQLLLTGQKRLAGFAGKWEKKAFSKTFKIVRAKEFQIQKSEYLEKGKFPIIDQGNNKVAGYSDASPPFSNVPIIVFGDHTRELKWIDFPFFLGADGVVLLQAFPQVDLRFGFQLLQGQEIPSLGYSRHMKLLKEMTFQLPPLPEQRAIAAVLSTLDAEIAALEGMRAGVQQQKRGLMDELLTGRTRVSV